MQRGQSGLARTGSAASPGVTLIRLSLACFRPCLTFIVSSLSHGSQTVGIRLIYILVSPRTSQSHNLTSYSETVLRPFAKTETTAGSGVVSVLVSGSSHSSKFLSHDRSLLARVCACHRRGDLLQGRLDEVQPGRWECVPKQVMLHVRLMCKCMVLPSLACAVLLVVGHGCASGVRTCPVGSEWACFMSWTGPGKPLTARGGCYGAVMN